MPEIVKIAGEAGVDIITYLINQIIVEGVFPAEWELGSIVSCCKRKGGLWKEKNMSLELTDQIRRLKSTDYILKIVERVAEKLTRQFGFMPGCGTTNTNFILRQLQVKYLTKGKNLYFALVVLEKVFEGMEMLYGELRGN